MKKIRNFVLFAVLVGFVLSACKTESNIEKSSDELADAIIQAIPLESGYYEPSQSYFGYYFTEDDGSSLGNESVSDWTIMKSKSQSSENEIGVLFAESGCVGRVRECCEAYLEERREAYLEAKAAYTPTEYEKYRDAEIKAYGNCVVYLILDAEDRRAAIDAIEAELSK